MLASSFHEWRSIRLSAADQSGQSTGVEGALLVDLTQSGARLSGELLTFESLRDRLAQRMVHKPDQRVLVRPAGGVDMQRMVVLLDSLAQAGVENIALMPGS